MYHCFMGDGHVYASFGGSGLPYAYHIIVSSNFYVHSIPSKVTNLGSILLSALNSHARRAVKCYIATVLHQSTLWSTTSLVLEVSLQYSLASVWLYMYYVRMRAWYVLQTSSKSECTHTHTHTHTHTMSMYIAHC